jgi:lantibiotic biosynthesis protein
LTPEITAGPLALLSATMRRGTNVSGHGDAIHTICAWLDHWRQESAGQAWWPEVIDRHEHRTGTASLAGPHRPSWCYGTPGIARAQQLAAIAVGDPTRRHHAEQALTGCLTDDRQLTQLATAGLCHGWAGLVHTARRAATDANTSDLVTAAAAAGARMQQHLHQHGTPADHSLLEGTTGIALATVGSSPATTPAQPPWDTCMLVS